jgi:hypothetical protein
VEERDVEFALMKGYTHAYFNCGAQLMGLDIVAYRNAVKIEAVFDKDDEWTPLDPISHQPMEDELVFIAAVDERAATHALPLTHRGVYRASEEHSFRAGSYSGYNWWRNELARMAGYPGRDNRGETSYCLDCWEGKTGPFSELINFSDCEGTIGSEYSTKLARDFAEFDAKALAMGEEFYESYQDWRKAFELAADNGAVILC